MFNRIYSEFYKIGGLAWIKKDEIELKILLMVLIIR
jgi:hypothetical protein